MISHETLDTGVVTAILLCSIYECWILTKEYRYDEQKDEVKKQRKTRTSKRTTTQPDGAQSVEEAVEITEPVGEQK